MSTVTYPLPRNAVTGRNALSAILWGGLATAGLGTLLHFFIAFVAAAVYVVASRLIPALNARPRLFGPLFGIAVFFFMNYGVLPLSTVGLAPFSLGMFLNGIFGHAFFVGLPVALFARRAGRESGFDHASRWSTVAA
jgi:hypothetical protein